MIHVRAVPVSWSVSRFTIKMTKISHWLRENLKRDDWDIDLTNPMYISYIFKNDEDGLAFTLKFGL